MLQEEEERSSIPISAATPKRLNTHRTGRSLRKQAVVANTPTVPGGKLIGKLFDWKKVGNDEIRGTPEACKWLQKQLGDSYWVTDVHSYPLLEGLGFFGKTDLLIFPSTARDVDDPDSVDDAIACVELKARVLSTADKYQAMAEAVVMSHHRRCQSPCLLTNLTDFHWIIPTNRFLYGRIVIEDVKLSTGGQTRDDVASALECVRERLEGLKKAEMIDVEQKIEQLNRFGKYIKGANKEDNDMRRKQLASAWSQIDESEQGHYMFMQEVMQLLTPPNSNGDGARLKASDLNQEVCAIWGAP